MQSEADQGVAPFCQCQGSGADGNEGKKQMTRAAYLAKCCVFSGLAGETAKSEKGYDPGIIAPLAINQARKLTPAMIMAIGKSSPIFMIILK